MAEQQGYSDAWGQTNGHWGGHCAVRGVGSLRGVLILVGDRARAAVPALARSGLACDPGLYHHHCRAGRDLRG